MRKMPPQNRATRFCASFSVSLVLCFGLAEGGWVRADSVVAAPLFNRLCNVFGVSCFAFGFGGVWGGGGADSVVAAPLFTERKLEFFCGSKSANSRLAAVIKLPPHRSADAMGSISNAMWQMRHVTSHHLTSHSIT